MAVIISKKLIILLWDIYQTKFLENVQQCATLLCFVLLLSDSDV